MKAYRFADAAKTRRRTAADVMRTDIVAEAAVADLNCKLIEQDPDTVLQAHFHRVDQFQVFVGGSGRIGKRSADPVTVHFTKAQTPYGPLAAGPDGLSYIVVRAERDSGAEWMPEAADRRDRTTPRGHAVSTPLPPSTTGDLGTLTGSLAQFLIEPDDAGLAATLLRIPPGGATRSPNPSLGRGLVLVVTAGTVMADGALGPNSCIHVGVGDGPIAVTAGEQGAEVVALSFPKTEVPA